VNDPAATTGGAFVLETERLTLRRLTTADAAFIFELVNEPSFIQNIGDRNVRSHDDAVRYIEQGPVASYEQHGFGLYLVEVKDLQIPIGICGVLKRDSLDYADIGFAFLPHFWRHGYAIESAAAVMGYARNVLGLGTIAAITSLDNGRSIKLLDKLGFEFQGMKRLTETEPAIKLFLSKY
jgi:ribosomal-protein-alanine N-acetyltransferase